MVSLLHWCVLVGNVTTLANFTALATISKRLCAVKTVLYGTVLHEDTVHTTLISDHYSLVNIKYL